MTAAQHRFSIGPSNINRADPFSPPVRPQVAFDDALTTAVSLVIEGLQRHDDEAVPDVEHLLSA